MGNDQVFEKLREQKVLSRIAQLNALGLSAKEIAEMISDEFNIDAPKKVVKSIIKGYSVKGSEFLEKDKQIALTYKKLLYDLIEEGRDNLKIMKKAKESLWNKVKIYEEDSILSDAKEAKKAAKEMVSYINRIQDAIRTQNDNIRTLKPMFDILGTHKKEVTAHVSGIESIQEKLIELEKSGYITINPRFKELKSYNIERGSDKE